MLEDTEEMRKCEVEESIREALSEVEVHPWNGGGCANTRNTEQESGEKIAGQDFFYLFRAYNVQSLHCKQEESTEEEEMKLQQIMVIMKDLIRKIRSEGRMDAKNRWWVSELLRQTVRKYFAEIQKLVGGDEKNDEKEKLISTR